MSEIVNIFFISLIFSLISFFPFFKKLKNQSRNILLSGFDLRILNILFICNFILILAIFNVKITEITYIFYFLILISIFYIFFNFNKLTYGKNFFFYFSFFVLIIIILSVDLAYNLTLYWDAQKMWYPKAMIFYYDGSIAELKNSSYNHYSFLGSLLWAFFWKITNLHYEYFGRMFFLVIFCLSLFNFLGLTKLSKEKKIISLLFLILLIYDYWHLRGTQEILIFSFLLICSKYLFNILFENKNDVYNIIFILLTLNLIVWTKNEGIIVSLLITSILFIFLKKNLKFRIILVLLFSLLVFLRFYIFKIYGLNVDLSTDFDFQNIFNIFFNNFSINNLLLISKYIIISFLKFPHVILSLICSVIVAFDRKLFKKSLFLYFYLFTSILFIFFVYLSSDQNINRAVSTGSLRLMFEFSAPYLLFVVLLLKSGKFKNKFL